MGVSEEFVKGVRSTDHTTRVGGEHLTLPPHAGDLLMGGFDRIYNHGDVPTHKSLARES